VLDTRQRTLDGWAPANDGTTAFAGAAQRFRDRPAEWEGRRGNEAGLLGRGPDHLCVAALLKHERIRRSNVRVERRRDAAEQCVAV
jgi:hypothetical protein